MNSLYAHTNIGGIKLGCTYTFPLDTPARTAQWTYSLRYLAARFSVRRI